MDFYYLQRSILFDGCTRDEIKQMLTCFNAQERSYKKDEIICPARKPIRHIGIVLEGTVRTEHTNYFGETTILTVTDVGKSFGEAYACAPTKAPMLDFVANENCRVMFIEADAAMNRCDKLCPHHLKVSTNLIELISLRYLDLARRAYIVSQKSMREKILAFLSDRAMLYDSHEFDIHLNREQMANYLGVDRSALSAELSRMKKAGLIEYHKNHFIVKKTTDVL